MTTEEQRQQSLKQMLRDCQDLALKEAIDKRDGYRRARIETALLLQDALDKKLL